MSENELRKFRRVGREELIALAARRGGRASRELRASGDTLLRRASKYVILTHFALQLIGISVDSRKNT